jgi:hypothetical protein
MKLTLAQLEGWGACDTAIQRFKKLFGICAEVNAASIERWRLQCKLDGYGGHDVGWLIWYMTFKGVRSKRVLPHCELVHRAVMDRLKAYIVKVDRLKDISDRNVTTVIGREYSHARAAAAISQTFIAVKEAEEHGKRSQTASDL